MLPACKCLNFGERATPLAVRAMLLTAQTAYQSRLQEPLQQPLKVV